MGIRLVLCEKLLAAAYLDVDVLGLDLCRPPMAITSDSLPLAIERTDGPSRYVAWTIPGHQQSRTYGANRWREQEAMSAPG